MQPVSAIVLAGGASRRMGTNKALLAVHGETLIGRTVARVRPLCRETIVVTNDPDSYRFLTAVYGTRLVPDAYPDSGSLVGLYSGLLAATAPLALALACDMPLLNVGLLTEMLSLAVEGVDAVVPELDGRAEPLHAVYRPVSCAPAIRASLDAGQRRMISFLPAVNVHYLDDAAIERFDPRHHSFKNANTPQDWEAVLQLIEAEAG